MLDSQSTCRNFSFYLLPAFSLQAFSSAVEALRLANEVLGRDVYSWQVISDDGQPAASSCGLLVCADSSLPFERERTRRLISAPAVVVVGGRNAPGPHKQLDAWLRECRNRRGRVVGISSGTIALARAGLAEGRRCAVHWEQFPIFSERFPGVIATQTAFERDGNLYTCAGGGAPFDMFLDLVDHHHGAIVVNRICEKAIACRIRSAGDRQRLPLHSRVQLNHQAVIKVIEAMEANLTEPLPLDEIVGFAGLSRRQIERLFRRELGCSPSRYYLDLRLEKAHLLLISSRLPIVEIAMACGFVSASHFSKAYRDAYGCAPHQSRLPVYQRKRMRSTGPENRTLQIDCRLSNERMLTATS
ncbi:MAG: GlxA family transcriptional regulator [Mesorhizobium sp.]|uniref:GlxA family transcriptional regulator n=1 Tax=Mesorhizobium sp. TaxID=1871066 RepID=UPI000FE83EAA|nr:GlxA family transcriptional regulator [Mesorhizobium sp.]RWD50781.1 MAG: GlxA family transcriptional regulator [Mesorhizobium sp.]RWE58677.1 MAG: GlxA family transcriptional regulator [Mesorhizobium sp.]RWF09078.1 MAG: GlxA family transcriptional regulator [Mesorhizobium sp.]RWF22339.1 MAG: GlxA family transcriptional regulator [Mesorhizobium sp.]TIY04905.1 MAG: GlxA family transcriptional regulator [Mesorhizobium sp.]